MVLVHKDRQIEEKKRGTWVIGERKRDAGVIGEKKRKAGMTSAGRLGSLSHPMILVVGFGQLTGVHSPKTIIFH